MGLVAVAGRDFWVSMEVVTVSGRACEVSFFSSTVGVQVGYRGECCAVLDRERLRLWLADPGAIWAVGEVVFVLDWSLYPVVRPAIRLADVGVWAFAPSVLSRLRGSV